MSQGTFHIPVMKDEVVELLAAVPPGVVVDATIGGGGHAAAILESRPDLVLVGIDRDRDAVAEAATRLARFGDRAQVHHARFDALGDVLAESVPDRIASAGGVSAVLFDLGVSSHQLDDAARGFSYRVDAPLDMRMDRDLARSARDLVNTLTEDDLARLFAAHGEERFALAEELAVDKDRTGKDRVVQVLELWASLTHDLLLCLSAPAVPVANLDYEEEIRRLAQKVSRVQSEVWLQALLQAQRQIERNVSPRLALEISLLAAPRV